MSRRTQVQMIAFLVLAGVVYVSAYEANQFAQAACTSNECKDIPAYWTCNPTTGGVTGKYLLEFKDCDKCKQTDGYCDQTIDVECQAGANNRYKQMTDNGTICKCMKGRAYVEAKKGIGIGDWLPANKDGTTTFPQRTCKIIPSVE